MRLFEPPEVPETESPPPAPATGRRRVMLLVAYDGSSFHGFAAQPGRRTVGGALVEALTLMTGHPVAITCAGRTDTGVHAAGQVVHSDLDAVFAEGTVGRLARSLTRQLGPAIAVLDAALAPQAFDARHSALSRRYRYDVLTGPSPDPLLRHRAWHVPGHLELPAMRMSADALLGSHDFSGFCRKPPDPGRSLVRAVREASWHPGIGEGRRVLRFEIEANAFCHRMVRSIVGTLVSVGEGRLTCADMVDILRSGDRAAGGRTAPPEGLTLELVRYPSELVPGQPPDGVWRAPAG